jgi:predicted secreted hydrolase
MESLTKEIEIQIGQVTYYFDAEFYYYSGTNELDPTEGEDWEYQDHQITSDILAIHENGLEYIVTDQAEREQVLAKFHPESELEEALL